ncbi:Transcription factor unc-86 [Borealophlyctis nickersoniae]|nr:Transcription factor unc-86 [Borealophlyctis nickersoniae]
MKCAVAAANEMPDFLPGMNVYWDIVDDGDDAIHSVYKSMGFMNEGIMAVVGAASSSNTAADSPVLSSFNIPLVSYASSSESLSDITRYPTLVRTVASDAFQTKAMVSLALKMGWSLIGAVGTDDTYGAPGLASFISDATDANIKVSCQWTAPFSGGGDVSAFAACVKSIGVKVIMIFSNEANAAAIVQSLVQQNAVPDDMVFIASDSWSTTVPPATLKSKGISPTVLSGTISTIQWPGNLSSIGTCFAGLTPQNNNYTLFINFWESRFKCDTAWNSPLPVCADNYVPTASAGSGSKAPCKCSGKESLANDVPNNKAGLVNDAVYAILNALHVLIHDCYSLPATMQSSCASPVITANDILMAIRALRFQGLSGDVQFSGTDRTSVSYSYIQFNGTAWNQIGSWSTSGTDTTNSTGTVRIDDTTLVWRPGYSSAPVSVLEPEMVTSKMPLSIIIKTLSAIGMAVDVFLAVYFYRNREHAVIKRASPTFCIMMLFGMLLIFADLFLWDGPQTDALCLAKVWVPLVGFGCVMGPMLVKTFRIYKIFDSNRLRAHKLQDSQLLGMSSIVVAGELILLIVWSAGDPVRAILVDSSSSELYTSQKCLGAHPDFQQGLLGCFIAYNALLLALGVVMSYKTRNVHSSFNESRYIAYAIYNITLCVVVLLPIYMTIGDNPGSSQREYIVRSLATLFANIACMLILFGPKLYQVYRDAQADEYDSSGGGGGTGDTPKGTTSPQPMGRRQSAGTSQMMFARTPGGQRRPSQESVGAAKGEKGKDGGGEKKPTVKVMKTVKTTIEEGDESSVAKSSVKGGQSDTGDNAV